MQRHLPPNPGPGGPWGYPQQPSEAWLNPVRIEDVDSNRRQIVLTLGERCFCAWLMVLSVLILVAVITFGSLALVELTDINGEVYPVRCNDNNPCTVDFYRFEACHSLPSKNGVDCNDSCLVSGAGTCFAGECTGGCPGTCAFVEDCPDIMNFEDDPLDKECFQTGCIYRKSEAENPLPLSAGSSGHLGEKFCDGFLHRDEPLRSCLEILPFYTSINPDENNDGLRCVYAFRCATYQRPVV